jgi:hypothetical protein
MGKIYNKEKKRKYQLENRERIRKQKREYYLKNRDKFAAKSKKYNEEHKEEIRAWRKKYSKKYYLENRERIRERHKEYYLKHRDEFAVRSKKYDEENEEERRGYRIAYYWENKLRYRESNNKVRMAVLEHYGGDPPRCACCGESQLDFLAVDHIQGGGKREIKALKTKAGTQFYQWIVKHDYPPRYQVLCHNCNMSKGFYGYCPHQKEGHRIAQKKSETPR